MGRSPCCEKLGLKKGPWTPEEDQKLLAYIEEHGIGSWRALPEKAGLPRCGKSCRLRWTNYLRPDIKRGKFNLQEEHSIIQLHALLGNRWSAIATHLPKRTDNEIKNYWNTHLKKRLTKMGIDPVTHKPKSDFLSSINGEAKIAANLSHMAQWESARLEAEARLVRESKFRSSLSLCSSGSDPNSDSVSGQFLKIPAEKSPPSTLCLDVLKAWQGSIMKSTKTGVFSGDFDSPKTILSFSENAVKIPTEKMESGGNSGGIVKEEGETELKGLEKKLTHESKFKKRNEDLVMPTSSYHDVHFAGESSDEDLPASNFIEGFTNLLLDNLDHRDSDIVEGNGGDDYEEDKNYWNNLYELVNSSPSGSPVF